MKFNVDNATCSNIMSRRHFQTRFSGITWFLSRHLMARLFLSTSLQKTLTASKFAFGNNLPSYTAENRCGSFTFEFIMYYLPIFIIFNIGHLHAFAWPMGLFFASRRPNCQNWYKRKYLRFSLLQNYLPKLRN